MLKPIFALSFMTIALVSSNFADAAIFDPDNYTPTLNKLESEGKSPIDSAYTLSMQEVNEADYNSFTEDTKFISYNVVAGKVTPVYYTYTYSAIKPSSEFIKNDTDYGDIEGAFIGLDRSNGAIYNKATGTIGDIHADFIDNGSNGAIENYGEMGDIVGDFIGNHPIYPASNIYRAIAILNDGGKINSITGVFIGNRDSPYGAIFNVDGSIGDINASFINNNAVEDFPSIKGGHIFSGAIHNGSNRISSTIGNITGDFIANGAILTSSEGLTRGFGGAISNTYSTIGNITGNFIGNYMETTSLSISESFGGAIFNSPPSWGGEYKSQIGNVRGNFISNHVYSSLLSTRQPNAYGGAIFSGDLNTSQPYMNSPETIITFLSSEFVGNYAKAKSLLGDKAVALGGAIYLIGNEEDVINFTPVNSTDYILFKDNYTSVSHNGGDWETKLSSIHIEGTAVVNFLLQSGTYADVRDPISGTGIINKDKAEFYDADGNIVGTGDGLGSLYLWGDNSEFTGEMNIKEGNFYAMFVEDDTEWNGQRAEFNLDNAQITFGNYAYFRPMMNNAKDKLAELTKNRGNITHEGTTYLAPYGLSGLDVGGYSFNNNYDGFSGWSSRLAELIINVDKSVDLEIKRELNGYDGLNELADYYRKRNDLSLMEREILDNIYITGIVPEYLKDTLNVIEGEDYETFEQVHRASVRQFNRQIVSRIHNKNCTNCGINSGFSDQHLWFNVSHNHINKDTTKKSLGYEYKPTGFAIGYDYDFIPNELTLGVALSYATGEVKNKTSGNIRSKADVDEYMASFYGKYKPFRAYVGWNTGGGLIKNQTNLKTLSVDAKGDYNTYAFFANTEFGYDLGISTCETLEPYIGLEYTHILSKGYNERGTGARHFDRMDWDIFEIPIGIRASKDFFWNEYILTPAIDLAYARNFGDTSAKTTAAFVGNRGDKWSVGGGSDKRDSLRGNFNFKINNLVLPFALNLGYSIDYRSDFTDQQFYGTIRFDF